MNYILEILESEDKNVLVLSSENVFMRKVELDENSDLNQFINKTIIFLPSLSLLH